MDDFYANKLKGYLTDPNSFQSSPGFQFALNTGLDGVSRQLAAKGMSDSGNALAELTKYGTGLASQEYGNTLDRLGKFSGQEQQYDLGLGQNANTATRNANEYDLGLQQNANTNQNNYWNYDLGLGRNANEASRNQNDFNLGVGRNQVDFMNAGTNRYNAATNRGSAQSADYYRGQDNSRLWDQFYRGK